MSVKIYIKTAMLTVLIVVAAVQQTNAQEPTTVGLKDIVEAAIAHSKQIKISDYQLEQAHLSEKKAYRSYLPSITAEAGYTRLNSDIVFPEDLQNLLTGTQWLLIKERANLPFNQPASPELMGMLAEKGVAIKETPPIQEKNILRANLTAQMVLFSGGQIPYSIKAASHQQNAIALMSEQEKSNITLEVISLYDKFAVIAKSEEVLINTEIFLEEQKRFVQKAYANGLTTKLDLQKIELAQQQLLSKKIELTTAKKLLAAKLSQMSGLENNTLLNCQTELEVLSVAATTNDVNNRKDIQALNEAIIATDYKKKAELSAYAPKVVAFGKKEFLKDDLSMLDPEWAVGIALRWKIFDGFTASTKVKQVKFDRLILEEKRMEAVELLELKLRKEDLELAKCFQLIEVASKNVKIAQEVFELSKKQYEQGLIPQNEHLSTVNALEKARLNEIQAIYNQRLAAMKYMETTGNLDINNVLIN